MSHVRILSCDWGTSALRLRLASTGVAPKVLAEYRSSDGAATLAAKSTDEARAACFEEALRQAIQQLSSQTGESLDSVPIVISGMASSSIGWVSLPYARLPFDLNGGDIACSQFMLDSHPILLISGVRDETDVMRGEETELIGLMQLPQARPSMARCVAILPGTHSKHVDIVDGKIRSFRTMMTGELFSVLANHSVLRHSVRTGDEAALLPRHTTEPTRTAFVEGVRQVIETGLPSALFRTRTRQLLNGESHASNAAFLSGLLIGSEIVDLRHRMSNDESIVLCAGSAVADWYIAALAETGLDKRTVVIPAETVDKLSLFGHAAVQRLAM